MGYWAGLLSGLGEAHEKHNKTLLDQEIEKRKNLVATHKMIFEHPDATPELRDISASKMFGIQSLPLDKRIDKMKDLSDTSYISKGVKPRQGQSWPTPDNSATISGAPIPAAIMHGESGVEEVGAPRPGENRIVSAMSIPAAPPDYYRGAFYSPEERDARTAAAEGAKIRAHTQAVQDVMEPIDEKKRAEAHRYRMEELGLTGQYGVERTQAGLRPANVPGTMSGAELKKALGSVRIPGAPEPDDSVHYRVRKWPNGTVADYAPTDFAEPMVTVLDTNGQPVWMARKDAEGVAATGVSGPPLYQTMVNGVPTWVPRQSAQGQPAVVTTYGPGGVPSTGGVENVSRTPPPQIPIDTQQQLAGLHQGTSLIRRLMPKLVTVGPEFFGPGTGRLALFDKNLLGGKHLTPDQIRLLIQLRRLVSSQAFAEGGKQLTGTEKTEFTSINPSPDMTVANAIIAAQESYRWMQDKARLKAGQLTPQQQGLLPPDLRRYLPGNTAQRVPGAPGGGGGTVRMVTPDGKSWDVPADKVADAEKRGAKRVQ